MKKKILVFLLAFALLFSNGATFVTPVLVKADKPDDLVHISDFETLEKYLSQSEPADLILDKDMEYQNKLTDKNTIKTFAINGQKTLDLNGHRLSVKYDLQNGAEGGAKEKPIYPERGYSDSEIYEGIIKEKKETRTVFKVQRGSDFSIYDTSKDQDGEIIAHHEISRGTHHTREGYQSAYDDARCVNAFRVQAGGHLRLYSGAIIAGRSKEYWLTEAHDINDLTDIYTGNGRLECSGTGVTVEKEGKFDCYGGRVAGRGYEKIFMWISFCTTYGFMNSLSDSINEADVFNNCAAVRVLSGGTANIYDGQLTGNTGADALDAQNGSNVRVYSGYFNTTRQEHSIISRDLEHNLPYSLTKGQIYAKELFFDSGYGKVGIEKEHFVYDDDLIEIYEGKEKKESKRVTLKMQSTADDSSSTDGSTSAGITLVSGKSKIQINRKYSTYDGKAHAYLVCPAASQVYNFSWVDDAVSYTEAKMEYAKDTHCLLRAEDRNLFFPTEAGETEGYLTHGLENIVWRVEKQVDKKTWKVTPWGGVEGLNENGTLVDLAVALKDCKVGDVYRIYARFTEKWDSKHNYSINRVLVTPVITVVDHDLLCDHDYEVVYDTHSCKSSGIEKSICKKCGKTKSVEKPIDDNHQFVRKYDENECWDECSVCHTVDNKKTHQIEAIYGGSVNSTTEIVNHKCTYCDLSYKDYKEVQCQHEFSWNYSFLDEYYHWSYCLKCGACIKGEHKLDYIDASKESIGCHGETVNGNPLPCLYFRLADSEELNGAHHNIVDGQHIVIQRVFCAHKELLIDFSYLNDSLKAKSKSYEWVIEYYSNPDKTVTGKSTLKLADYLISGDDIIRVTAKVTVDGKVFTAEAERPMCVEVKGHPATCKESGEKDHWMCPGCMQAVDSSEQNSKVIDVTIPRTDDHIYDNDCDETCNNCGYVREAPHNWETTVDENNNTVPVYSFHNVNEHAQKCKDCKAIRDICGHDWNETVIRKSDCLSMGEAKFDCVTCGYSITGTYTVLGEHDYEVVSESPESCNGDGSITYKCKVCGDTYTSDIPMIDHIPIFAESFLPTCSLTGEIEHFKCPMCDTLFSDEAGENVIKQEDVIVPIDTSAHYEEEEPEYSYNETHHWSACDCGIVTISDEHTYGEDGACTECGYIPGVDLILSEAAKEAGGKIMIAKTPAVGEEMPVIKAPQGLTFKMFMTYYWWLILIGVAFVGMAVLTIVLLKKLKAVKKNDNDQHSEKIN